MKTELGKWFERKYLEWQLENGIGSQIDFAAFIGMSRPYLTQILSGKRTTISERAAALAGQRLNDYSIMDICGYTRPEDSMIAEAYPPEVWERFKAAASEILSEYRARGWDRSSPGAEVLATEIMAKHGFTYSNRNS